MLLFLWIFSTCSSHRNMQRRGLACIILPYSPTITPYSHFNAFRMSYARIYLNTYIHVSVAGVDKSEQLTTYVKHCVKYTQA
ncbi:hypothetical protein PHLGIDRAFT_387594 [Phlebiopsis gigantea 11061_1 CR5-6]|uniref:Uncharacterized protein n=1 Tax=Phlebiopsis gigantea (strain 11061_1 CR5-6) TaxID=745531 RepID=A0A0C3S9E6_PHLG1|nr:hypothetical protein PHLGIDRAFT_387594 [Phlebiopsis gigantea 11061_1 CR5-6]